MMINLTAKNTKVAQRDRKVFFLLLYNEEFNYKECKFAMTVKSSYITLIPLRLLCALCG